MSFIFVGVMANTGNFNHYFAGGRMAAKTKATVTVALE